MLPNQQRSEIFQYGDDEIPADTDNFKRINIVRQPILNLMNHYQVSAN